MANTLLEQRRGQMFPKLAAAQLARLERQGTRLQTQAGEILQELGEISRGVFVVEAEVSRRSFRHRPPKPNRRMSCSTF